jgi:hypothetical protein
MSGAAALYNQIEHIKIPYFRSIALQEYLVSLPKQKPDFAYDERVF